LTDMIRKMESGALPVTARREASTVGLLKMGSGTHPRRL
jgi:hypothetical protein